MPRMLIDNLTPGQLCTLRFHSRASTTLTEGGRVTDEKMVFLRIEGTGDDRIAVWQYPGTTGEQQQWSSYRYQGYWAFGSSAERLQLLEVHE